MNLRTALLLVLICVLYSCGNNNSTPDPTISEIQPESGPPGTMVTIIGSGFTDDLSAIEVTFNGLSGDISNASESEIQATVPEGAESGPIEVTVGNMNAAGPHFTVEAKAPGISTIEPDSGRVGTEVLITGMNFSTNRSKNVITFNGTLAPVNGFSETELLTKVPEGATDGPVEVTVDQKTATGPDFEVIETEPLQNKIVFSMGSPDEDSEIFVSNPDGSEMVQLTNNSDYESEPAISPDGSEIAYIRNLEQNGRVVFVMNADGTNQRQVTTIGAIRLDWAPDGERILFYSHYLGSGADTNLFVINKDGSNRIMLTDTEDVRESMPA